MKKRLISILFILCLTVALSLSVSAESNKLTYAVGASAPTVSANTEFTILVEVTENTGICWLKAVVTYDSSVLTYVGASSDTSVYKDATITVNNTFNNKTDVGNVIVVAGTMGVFMNPNATIYTDTGRFVEIRFKVDANAAPGETTISVNTTSGDALIVNNGNFNTAFDVKSASTTVKIAGSTHGGCTPGTPVKEKEVPATCTNVGSYEEVVYCSVCSAELSRKAVIIPVSENHTPGEAVIENRIAGDCNTPAVYDSVVYCTACKKELSRTKTTADKGDHTPGAPEIIHTPATCTSKGAVIEVSKCSACGIEISRNTTELDMLAHIPDSTVYENEVHPTCLNEGSRDKVTYCKECKTKLDSVKEVVPKVAHTTGDPVKENEVAATCSKGGHYDLVTYCTVCKEKIKSETKVTEKLEHVRGSAVKENVKNPVNCGADGSYESVVYCTLCKVELSRVIQSIKAPAHTPGAEATETTPQICTVCNTVIAPAKGHTHKWGTSWTSDGVGHWHACSGCSEKKDYEQHHYANACDTDCNICGAIRSGSGHTYANDCDDSCDKCGEKRQIVGHVYDNDCDANCNTCGEVRVTSHKYDSVCDADCNVCGEKRTPADHVFGNWKTVTEATETKEGLRERACIVCGAKETEAIPATGSESTTDETTKAPEQGENTTDPEGSTTETPDNTDPEGTTSEDEESEPDVIEDTGCGSIVSAGVAIIAILGTAIIMKKRD